MPKIYEQSSMPLRDKLIDLYNRALEGKNEALANFIEQKLLQREKQHEKILWNCRYRGGHLICQNTVVV